MSFLSNLKTVKGNVKIMDLNVDNLGLTNFILENLESVGGNFEIKYNKTVGFGIKDFCNKLKIIEKSLNLSENEFLFQLPNCFNNLKEINENLKINNNLLLPSIEDSFNKLEKIGNNLEFDSNPLLTTLSSENKLSFKALSIINGSFIIKNNNSLKFFPTNSNEFNNLSLIKKSFILENNLSLQRIPSNALMADKFNDNKIETIKIEDNLNLISINNLFQDLKEVNSCYIQGNINLKSLGENSFQKTRVVENLIITNNNTDIFTFFSGVFVPMKENNKQPSDIINVFVTDNIPIDSKDKLKNYIILKNP